MKRLSDVKLATEYNGVPKGRLFQFGKGKIKPIYEILGFDLDEKEVEVFARRILRTTMSPSRKKPILQIFKFEDCLDQNIQFCF